MPQRPIVALIAAALSAVTIGGVGVVAHAADSATGTGSGTHSGSPTPPAPGFRPTPAARADAVTRQGSGAPALHLHRLVDVAVANVWVGPHKPRRVDAPSLREPVQLDRWLHTMTVRQRSGLTPRLDTQLRYGEDVVVLRQQEGWSRVRIPSQTGGRFPHGIKGWMVTRQLAELPADWYQHPTVASVTAVRTVVSSVTARHHSLALSYATTLPLVTASPRSVTVELPGTALTGTPLTGTLPRSSVALHATGTPAIHPSLTAAVAQAKRFLGLPYLWAGTSAWGFDCSGLTETVYGQLGLSLPRDAADQSTIGRPISRRHLQPGDLVFFSYRPRRAAIHHVAIYVGHGQVIQSPYSGARVQITSLWHSSLGQEYWGATNPLAS